MFLNRRDHVALLLVYIVLLYKIQKIHINHFFCIKRKKKSLGFNYFKGFKGNFITKIPLNCT